MNPIEKRAKNKKIKRCNTYVTKCNSEIEKELEIDKEKDTETEIEKKDNGKKQQKKVSVMFYYFFEIKEDKAKTF